MSLSPEQLSLRASIGGHARAAKYDGREVTGAARAARFGQYLSKVDEETPGLPEGERLRRAEHLLRADGVVISKRGRDVILSVLVINERRWRQLVKGWTDRYIAHRCSAGVVTLFTKPLLTECPNCHRWIEGSAEAKPRIKSKPRGRPFERSGSDTAVEAALVLPPSGANVAAGAAQMVPFLGHELRTPRPWGCSKG